MPRPRPEVANADKIGCSRRFITSNSPDYCRNATIANCCCRSTNDSSCCSDRNTVVGYSDHSTAIAIGTDQHSVAVGSNLSGHMRATFGWYFCARSHPS